MSKITDFDPTYIECMILIAHAYVRHVAEEIVSVQPMNVDMVAVMNDPACRMLMANFVAHTQGKPRPYPYE